MRLQILLVLLLVFISVIVYLIIIEYTSDYSKICSDAANAQHPDCLDNLNRQDMPLHAQINTDSGTNKATSQCKDDHCTVIIPVGDYKLSNTLHLNSNLTLYNYGRIYASESANFSTFKDLQGDVFASMIYGNDLENIRIYNYGLLSPSLMYDSEQTMILLINNSNNVDIHGGHVSGGKSKTAHGISIMNSDNVSVHDTYSEALNETIWQECTQNSNIYNITCMVGGYEGECIDMNGYSQDVSISDIFIKGGNTNVDQAIDLNANRNVTLNNIYAKNAYAILKVTGFEPGVRYGVCDAVIVGDIRGKNISCENCTKSDNFVENASKTIQDIRIQYDH